MTSTSFNVGIGDGSRLSSRVLRPPGGGHTDIFGGEAEAPRGRRAGPPQAASTFMPEAQAQGEPKATNGNSEAPQNGQEAAAAPEPAPQVTAEAKPEPKESPKQAEPANFNQPEPVKAEPAKRVRVPPGGFSSGLW